jgi:hypothetical protein
VQSKFQLVKQLYKTYVLCLAAKEFKLNVFASLQIATLKDIGRVMEHIGRDRDNFTVEGVTREHLIISPSGSVSIPSFSSDNNTYELCSMFAKAFVRAGTRCSQCLFVRNIARPALFHVRKSLISMSKRQKMEITGIATISLSLSLPLPLSLCCFLQLFLPCVTRFV